MQFESWQAFWAMGGYGFFVWLAFGVSLASMAILVLSSVQARKRLVVNLEKEQGRQARIKASQAKSQMTDESEGQV